jgi:hypothetical protein
MVILIVCIVYILYTDNKKLKLFLCSASKIDPLTNFKKVEKTKGKKGALFRKKEC